MVPEDHPYTERSYEVKEQLRVGDQCNQWGIGSVRVRERSIRSLFVIRSVPGRYGVWTAKYNFWIVNTDDSNGLQC